MENFKLYYCLLLLPYFIYCAIRFVNDKTSEMREFIEPHVEKFGYKIKKIENLKSNLFNMPFNWVDEDIYVHTACAGKFALRIDYYAVYKKITIHDQNNKEFMVNVALDFSSFHRRKLKRIRFNPNLKNLIQNDKKGSCQIIKIT